MAQNQEQIEARLCAYIDGVLDPAERAEIEKHLEANPQHSALLQELMAQRDLLHALPRENAPAEIVETIQGQLERSVLLGSVADGGDMQSMRISRWSHRGAIAAILLLAAGLGILIYKVLPSNKPPEFAVTPKETGPVPATLETEESPPAVKNFTLAEKAAPATPMASPASPVPPEPTTAPMSIAAAVPEQQSKPENATAGELAMTPGAASNTASVVNAPLMNAMDRSGDLGTNTQPLRPAPMDISNGSISLIVATDDASTADEQVRAFLTANAIAWEPITQTPPTEARELIVKTIETDAIKLNAFRSTFASTQAVETSQAKAAAEPATTEAVANAPAVNEMMQNGIASTQPDIPGAIASTTAPSSQPTDQPVADANASPLSYFCRNVTMDQAHDLAGMLSSRPGQSALVIGQPQPGKNRSFGMGGGGGAGGFEAALPSTQPTTATSMPVDQLQTSRLADKTEKDANPFSLQQQVVLNTSPTTQPEQQHIDLLIVIHPQVSATSRPSTLPVISP